MFLYQLQRACYYPESYPTVSLLSSLKLFMQWLGVPLSGMLQKGLCSWVNLMTASIAWQIPWTEEPWKAAVHGVTKSRTRLSDFTSFTSIYIERERQREGHREREVVSDSLQPHGL